MSGAHAASLREASQPGATEGQIRRSWEGPMPEALAHQGSMLGRDLPREPISFLQKSLFFTYYTKPFVYICLLYFEN